MTAIYIFAAALLIVLAFAIGRATANKVEKLNNEQVLQERDKIRDDIAAEQKKALDAAKEYQTLKAQATAVTEKIKILQEQKESEKREQERQKETREQELQDLFAEKEKILETKHDETVTRIYRATFNLRHEQQIEADSIRAELESLKATRDAAIEAARKEREIAAQPADYSIKLTEDEAHDINYLNEIRSRLFFPQVVGKVIWGTFLQQKLKSLSISLLGTDKVSGIYKITDQLTQECYIGRSVNVADRFAQHVKCGVGATPTSSGNALYSAMLRDGIQNFTFELLEACPQEQLSEKEAFYINLYSADTYGLNSKQGDRNS